MTTHHATQPAAVARRQHVLNEMAEYLTERQCHAAETYARDLLDIVLAGGYALPRPLDDAPTPLELPANADHQAACMAQIRAALTAARQRTQETHRG